MKKKTGFEGGAIVPITRGKVTSSWVDMPCESNQRTKKGFTCMHYGQADASWRTYLQQVAQDRRKQVHASLDSEIARRRARLQARLDNS